jgi:parallel beta-helix repeat protein
MSRKKHLTAFGILISLLLATVFCAALNVQLVSANETIHIHANGSIDPPTAPITTTDNTTYTFTDNIYDEIIVERNNIIIDGANHTLQGTMASESKGIDLTQTTNVTIKNTTIKTFDYAIHLSHSSNNTLSANNITNNNNGISLQNSSNNHIYHNNLINNTIQTTSNNSTNTWDDGYPSGGNHYNDHNNTDQKMTPNQNVPGTDGITDTPYTIDTNNQDHYPLTKPWTPTTQPAIYISIPYHWQLEHYYCGPAALEMLFDFYGPDIPQTEIADAARTAPDGTYTGDMIRATHFSNLSTSTGKEIPETNITGYTARKFGYAAFQYAPMTINDLKTLITTGNPTIVLTTWHFRVAVGYDNTTITFQDPYYGQMFKMTYQQFNTDWDYSGHWGLFIKPWQISIPTQENISRGELFNVTANVTYPCPPPFNPNQYPASKTNVTITLPAGLTLAPDETAQKTINTGNLTASTSANVKWTLRAENLGNHTISVKAEGKVTGFVPSIPSYPDSYNYEDSIGGSVQRVVTVVPSSDKTPPTTSDDYNGLWHTTNFPIILTATDNISGIAQTHYKINDSLTKTVSLDGQPLITTEGTNNTLEYWSIDYAGNEESHHILTEIKLDKTAPTIGTPTRDPAGDIQPNQSVRVSANVTDGLSQVHNVTLYYNLNNGTIWDAVSANYNLSTNLYEATVPAQPAGTWVKYKIVAYDHAENNATLEGTESYCTYHVMPEYPSATIAVALIMTTLLTIVIHKRKRKHEP